MPEVLRNTFSKPLPRQCSQCGGPYHRRNLVEAWTGRNPGRRFGWHKEIAKVCLKCMTVGESNRAIGIADVQYSKKFVVLKKKSAPEVKEIAQASV